MKLTLEECYRLINDLGNLNLSGTDIDELPDNLKVFGDLYLDRSGIIT